MSKKEYGKGFTLDDLQAQRQSIWDTRTALGLRMNTAMEAAAPAPDPVTGPLWNAMALADRPVQGLMEAFVPASDAMARGQRAIANMLETVNAIGVTWPQPDGYQVTRRDDPVPENRSQAVGYFGGLPVFRENQVPRGFSTQPNIGPGWRATVVGYAKPEPIPEQPTGRFQNLDFEL